MTAETHPSPIARLSRELGDSVTKEILPPTERNLTMLSEGKLEELEKVARDTPPAWARASWEVHHEERIGVFEVRVEQDGDVDGDTGRHLVSGGELVALMPDALGEAGLAEFIATFDPPTCQALISELRALRAERDELQQRLSGDATLTAEGYVLAWDRGNRFSPLKRGAWEDRYQQVGLIDEARRRGYIEIARDVACTIAITSRGETLIAELAALRAQDPAAVSPDPTEGGTDE